MRVAPSPMGHSGSLQVLQHPGQRSRRSHRHLDLGVCRGGRETRLWAAAPGPEARRCCGEAATFAVDTAKAEPPGRQPQVSDVGASFSAPRATLKFGKFLEFLLPRSRTSAPLLPPPQPPRRTTLTECLSERQIQEGPVRSEMLLSWES